RALPHCSNARDAMLLSGLLQLVDTCLPLAASAPLWHLRKNIAEKNTMASIRYHEGDISAADSARYTGAIAIDTETLGLVPRRDRLCVVQLSPGDGSADVIRIAAGQKDAPNLIALLADPSRRKIFHYGRFDIAVLFHTFGVTTTPVFCTKIAS